MEPKIQPNSASWEITHSLYFVGKEQQWPLEKLISSIKEAEIHLSGWPIGVVLNREDANPKARKFGISATIKSPHLDEMFDYWELHRNGSFYFTRTLEESLLTYHGERAKSHVMHFDTRIRRTAEALLHCQKLYQALEVDPKQTIHFKICHFGLKGRTLSTSYDSFMRWHPSHKSEEDNHEFFKIYSLDLISADLKGIVYEATKSLFEYFNWLDYSKETCDNIIDKFLAGK